MLHCLQADFRACQALTTTAHVGAWAASTEAVYEDGIHVAYT